MNWIVLLMSKAGYLTFSMKYTADPLQYNNNDLSMSKVICWLIFIDSSTYQLYYNNVSFPLWFLTSYIDYSIDVYNTLLILFYDDGNYSTSGTLQQAMLIHQLFSNLYSCLQTYLNGTALIYAAL